MHPDVSLLASPRPFGFKSCDLKGCFDTSHSNIFWEQKHIQYAWKCPQKMYPQKLEFRDTCQLKTSIRSFIKNLPHKIHDIYNNHHHWLTDCFPTKYLHKTNTSQPHIHHPAKPLHILSQFSLGSFRTPFRNQRIPTNSLDFCFGKMAGKGGPYKARYKGTLGPWHRGAGSTLYEVGPYQLYM